MVIYSMRMAALLMLRGFVLLELKNNDLHPRKKVFIFKDTPELRSAMAEISKSN